MKATSDKEKDSLADLHSSPDRQRHTGNLCSCKEELCLRADAQVTLSWMAEMPRLSIAHSSLLGRNHPCALHSFSLQTTVNQGLKDKAILKVWGYIFKE